MVNYQNSKIYKITANEGKLVYVGCTTNTLKKRFNSHKTKAKTRKAGNHSYRIANVSSYPLFDYDDVKIELIEEYPCNDKKELHLRERHHIEQYDCVNVQKALVDHDEYLRRRRERYANDHGNKRTNKLKYYHENREKYKAYMKEYYYKNRDKSKKDKTSES